MSAWRRPPGYMAFVVLGLAGVVGATIATAVATSDDPGSKLPLYVGAGSVAVFVVGLLAYQWLGILLAGREEETLGPAPQSPGDPPADLLAALAVAPGIEKARRRARRGAMGGVVRNQAMITLMGLACAFGGILWVAGVNEAWYPFGDTGPGLPLAFAPVFVLIPVALLMMGTNIRTAVAAGDEMYGPLGLRTAALPRLVILPGVGDSTHLVGGTVVAGERHGRHVEVVLEGREHTVAIEGGFAPFAVRVKDGAFQYKGPVGGRLDTITPGPRWKGVTAEGGPDGIEVRRKGGGVDGRERWLDDLWLAEELATAARG